VVALWAAVYAVATLLRWWNLQCNIGDLAQHEQAMYNTLHGRFMWTGHDARLGGFGACMFGYHADLILLLFVPLYALWNSPVWFLLAQVGVLASGAIPVARLARQWYGLGAAGLVFATLYLLNPGLHEALMSEFHAETLAGPLLLWGIYFGLQRRLPASALALTAAALCKENIAGALILVGLYLAWKTSRRFGLGVAVLALVWGWVALKVIVPHFSPVGSSLYLGILDDPRRQALQAREWDRSAYLALRLGYLADVLGPVAAVCLLAPATAALSGCEVVLHLLSANNAMTRIMWWYHVTIVIGVILGAIAGLSWLGDRLTGRLAGGDPEQAHRVRAALLLGFLGASLCHLASHDGALRTFSGSWLQLPDSRVQATHRLLRQVPDEAAVLTNDPALANHLARRGTLMAQYLPGFADAAVFADYQRADYVVLLWTASAAEGEALARRYGLQLVGTTGEVWVWRVRHPGPSP
jgi:hypothetical protein